eukprot:s6622_g6.t1
MDERTSYAVKARTEMVHRVLEGLRDEAFELARDIGIESLTEPGGLRAFITQMRNVVFPRAAEEARDAYPQEDEDAEDYDDTSYPAFGDEAAEYEAHSYPAGEEDDEPSYEDFELDEEEATALNCLEDLDPEEAESGEDDEPSYEDFELDEEEATALNCLEDLDPEEAESGHVIQLQLAANAAFGRAKGRKGKGKGRGKNAATK